MESISALTHRGGLFVISGPSGAGKGTLLAGVLAAVENSWVSVSATTRAPRPGEVDGESYFFMTREDFEGLIANDGLLEWADVYGNLYGTPRKQVVQRIAAGAQIFLEIDVQGGLQVRDRMPEVVLIFVAPPSMEELERRLVGRQTESQEDIVRRLEAARGEIEAASCYDYIVVNDDLGRATTEILEIVKRHAESEE